MQGVIRAGEGFTLKAICAASTSGMSQRRRLLGSARLMVPGSYRYGCRCSAFSVTCAHEGESNSYISTQTHAHAPLPTRSRTAPAWPPVYCDSTKTWIH